MIDHRQIALRLRDVGMRRWQRFFPNTKRAKMSLLGLGVTLLVGVKDCQIIQNRSDVGVLGSELLFVNLKRVQVVRLGRFLSARSSENQRDVVEHRSQIRVKQVVELRTGSDRLLIVADRFFLLAKVIAQKSQSTRRSVKQALVGRLGFLENAV